MTSILQKLSYNWCVGYNVYFELSTEAIRLIFFDKADHCFEGLSNALDKVCRELRQEGLGTIRKGSSVFTAEEEDSLWKKGVIGLDTPVKLLRAVFFYNGINFALRGGAEHRSLKWSQVTRCCQTTDGLSKVCYIYVEHGSKNHSGGLRIYGI